MKKTYLILFLISISQILSAQKTVPQNLASYDVRKLRFGYTLGFPVMDFTIRKSANFLSDSVSFIESKAYPGFVCGIITEYHLSKFFDVRFLPGIIMGQRDITYNLNNKPRQVESFFFDLPVLLKYSSKRVNNYRTYLIGGGSYKIDLATEKELYADEGPVLRLKSNDLYYEVGFGFDYFLPYFKFSTELKLAVGITDILDGGEPLLIDAIERMNSRMFVFAMHFEGGNWTGDGFKKIFKKTGRLFH